MGEDREDLIEVQLAYALPTVQTVITLQVARGTTARAAIVQSGILEHHPEINFDLLQIGIFGARARLSALLNEHDRVELYRPLLADPKQARLKRVRKKQPAKR